MNALESIRSHRLPGKLCSLNRNTPQLFTSIKCFLANVCNVLTDRNLCKLPAAFESIIIYLCNLKLYTAKFYRILDVGRSTVFAIWFHIGNCTTGYFSALLYHLGNLVCSGGNSEAHEKGTSCYTGHE